MSCMTWKTLPSYWSSSNSATHRGCRSTAGGESSQPEGIAEGPVKRGRGRPRSQPVTAAATAAASVMQAPAAASAEANELHRVAPEPAGPVMSDAEQAEPPRNRKRRAAASVAESKQVVAHQLCKHMLIVLSTCSMPLLQNCPMTQMYRGLCLGHPLDHGSSAWW